MPGCAAKAACRQPFRHAKPWLALLVVVCLLPLSGCWDAVGLEDMTYPLLLGLDAKEGGVQVSALYFRFLKEEEAEPQITRAQARSVGLALQGLSVSGEHRWPAGLLQALVIGEQAARGGLGALYDFVLREPQLSMSFQLGLVRGSAARAMDDYLTDADSLWVLRDTLAQQHTGRRFVSCSYFHFVRDCQTPGGNPVMPVLSDSDGHLEVSGLAVFKKDRLLTMLSPEDTRMCGILRQNNTHSVLPLDLTVDGQLYQATVQLRTQRHIAALPAQEGLTLRVSVTATAQVLELIPSHALAEDQHFQQALSAQLNHALQQQADAFLATMVTDWQLDCVDVLRFAVAKQPEWAALADTPAIFDRVSIEPVFKIKLTVDDEGR